MLKHTIYEYGSIRRLDIPPPVLRQWQRFDEQHALRTGDTVFDWNHLHVVKAKSYVGVVQIGDLHIEVLPKIDNDPEVNTADSELTHQNTRQNFLYMLSMAGRLPLHERDLASQKLRRLPLWEALIRAFAARLLLELRRGQQHDYVYRQEDLPCVRGRILIQHQLTRNTALRHKIHVGYDEFSNDTRLNQILKAGCELLLTMTNLNDTQQLLREALLDLAEVEQQVIAPHDFEAVRIDRNSERFRDLLEFCRLVFLGTSPSPEIGHKRMFSFLFPMEVLFEEFVGACLKKFAEALGLCRSNVHLQAEANRRWLLRDLQGHGKFRLRPDVLVNDDCGQPRILLDTKWKRLLSDDVDTKNGVQQGDMYQLYAYSTRFECQNNILLFPRVPGVTPKRYIIDDESLTQLRVEFLDLSFDLRRERERLQAEFTRILTPGTAMPVNV